MCWQTKLASFHFDELDGEARAFYQNLKQFYICEIKSFVSIHIMNVTFTINEKASLVKVMSQSLEDKSHFDVNKTGKEKKKERCLDICKWARSQNPNSVL